MNKPLHKARMEHSFFDKRHHSIFLSIQEQLKSEGRLASVLIYKGKRLNPLNCPSRLVKHLIVIKEDDESHKVFFDLVKLEEDREEVNRLLTNIFNVCDLLQEVHYIIGMSVNTDELYHYRIEFLDKYRETHKDKLNFLTKMRLINEMY